MGDLAAIVLRTGSALLGSGGYSLATLAKAGIATAISGVAGIGAVAKSGASMAINWVGNGWLGSGATCLGTLAKAGAEIAISGAASLAAVAKSGTAMAINSVASLAAGAGGATAISGVVMLGSLAVEELAAVFAVNSCEVTMGSFSLKLSGLSVGVGLPALKILGNVSYVVAGTVLIYKIYKIYKNSQNKVPAQLKNIESDKKSFRTEIKNLEAENKEKDIQIAIMNEKLSYLGRNSRGHKIRLIGVPEQRGEACRKLVSQFIKDKRPMNDAEMADIIDAIENAHRTGRQKTRSQRHKIVRFHTRPTRNRLF